MATTCPQCTHTNPAGAKYCFFDGYSLSTAAQEGPVDPGSRPFPHPFVFPAGGSCENFDQLAKGCQKDWDTARELLREGAFGSFLVGLGRADLAMAAKEAVQFPDLDRGLDQFISRLPTQAVPAPRLRVEPAEVRLDSQPVGKDSGFVVQVRNLGSRLLYGSVAADAAWLQPGELADTGPKLIKFSSDGQVKVAVRGQHLRAGANTLEGKLIFETSGGAAEVVVKIDVPVIPFKEGVLAGAVTPRQLAEKALKAAKDAAPLFENGSVATWYKNNGWAYPVPGPVASGLGAVQQFFEALGLTKPPRLQLRDQEVKLAGAPGASLRHVLQITTTDNKPIFVHASANVPWITADRVQVKGAVASVALDIRQVPDQPGALLSARVIVTGNGNQHFDIPVSLQVAGVAPAPHPTLSPQGGEGRVRGEPVLEVAEAPARRKSSDDRSRTAPQTAAKPVAAELAGAAASSSRRDKGQAELDTAVSRQKTKPIVSEARSEPDNPFADLGEVTTSPRSPKKKTAPAENVFADVMEEDEGIVVAPRHGARKAAPSQKNSLWHLLPLVLLFLGLGGILIRDVLLADRPDETMARNFKVEIGDVTEEVLPLNVVEDTEDNKDSKVKVDITSADAEGVPIDPDPLVNFQINESKTELKSFGITTTQASGAVKKLTYAEDGSTNSTLVSVDGHESRFGNGTTGRRLEGGPPRTPLRSTEYWVNSNFRAAKDEKRNIFFTQTLEVVPGSQPVIIYNRKRRLLDTVLARCIIHNKDDVPHKVGMRFQIDTFIGGNDGVPFTVPGTNELVSTFADFKEPKDVPDFLQALEFPDLQKSGTIAHMTLKLGGKIEPPSRVSITRWPGNDNQSWEVPVEAMKGDSAVVLYWPEKELKPGEKRYIGYAYGLGTVTSEEKASNALGLTLGGSFEPGQSFTITAYARNPVPGQKLTLQLPDGLEKLSGDDVVTLPPARANQTSLATWKARVLRTGEFTIRVISSTGVAQAKTITISPAETFAGKFVLEMLPPFEPGKVCQVNARVSDPVPGQTLSLTLPAAGMENVDNVVSKKVPATKGDAVVSWKIKVLNTGSFQVKVVSSTGATQSKTLNIFRPISRVDLQPRDFAPGKTFKVIAEVHKPAPGQKLTLELPKGLECKVELTKLVPDAENSEVSWPVKILEPGTFPIKVSTPGFAIKKTLTVDEPGSGSFKMEFPDAIAPGKEFRIMAKVDHPTKTQKLTLKLPPGIKLIDPSETISVPAADRNGVATVTWKVRLDGSGELPVRIESSTGQAKVRIIRNTIF